MLADHALAYICAFYADALDCRVAPADRCGKELRTLDAKMKQAEETLISNRRFLTKSGQDFLQETIEVAAETRH
jgi:hypothetical protein